MPAIRLVNKLGTPQQRDPCNEVERDAQGRPIPDPLTGYKLTARAREASRQKFQKAAETHPPMSEIPFKYIPTLTQQHKPLLHWGFAFTDEQMLACLHRHKLLELDPEDPHMALALFKVLGYLQRRCGVKLKRARPLSMEYKHVVSLYSNFTMADTVMTEETEECTQAIIREELGIQGNAMWWWDIENVQSNW